ncbi:MAG: methylenetetrahydrofolate reductase [Dehalococcoidia bacterium]
MTNSHNGSKPPASTEPPKYYGRLHERLAKGEFACTIELAPPRGAALGAFRRAARSIRDWVDAANVTDNQSAYARMAGWAGCVALQQEGIEPVMQLQCRDRNRIALQAELLGAAGIGIPNVLLLTGDHQRFGDHPEAKGVFDMDSIQLVWTAKTMRKEQKLISGTKLSVAPKWLIGAVENPFAAPQEWRAERLGKKIAAGAEFVQTQLVYDVPMFAKWMQQVRDLGFDRRCYILPTLCPVRSVRGLEYMQKELSGIWIPEAITKRIRGVEATDVEEEGLKITIEAIQQLREIPGVAGIHVSMPGQEEHYTRLLIESGVRTAPLSGRDELVAPLVAPRA